MNFSFLCIFNTKNTGEASFNIVETNQFKALTHLSLKFREANDTSLKQYLANRLVNEKATTEELRNRVDRLEDNLNIRGSELEKVHFDFQRLQADKDKQIEETILDEKRKMNEAKESALAKETSLLRDFEEKRKEMVNHYEQTIRELQEKVLNFSNVNHDLSNVKIELEGRQRELSGRTKVYEKENAVLQAEIENLRVENKELTHSGFNGEKKITELLTRIESLEGQVRNRDELIRKNNELIESSNTQKVFLCS